MSDTVEIPRSVFRSEDRTRILAAAVGNPTGVMLEIGGQTVDLVALSTADGLVLFELVGKVGAIYEKITAGQATNQEIFAALGDDGPRAVALIRSNLQRSFFYGIADPKPDELALFNEWFEAVPAVDLIAKAVPKLLTANGVTNLTANPPSPATETSQRPPLDGITSTQSNSS